ncbi:MAG: hypothetical protein JNL87_16150 [Burkholderiaceae bacterium]|nr:hypothetical protein [Burkholderiaceae bacterium]
MRGHDLAGLACTPPADRSQADRQPVRAPDGAAVHYERHCPEQTTLHRLVQQHTAGFIAHTEASVSWLPTTPLLSRPHED